MLSSDKMNSDCSAGLENGQEGSEVTQVTGVLARLCDVRSGFIQRRHSCLEEFIADQPYSPSSSDFTSCQTSFFQLYKEI